MSLELFISLITCSPSSCTRSPQHNFPEFPGILTLACLCCLKSRQVMKLRLHWVCGRIITSLESLFSALIITSCMSRAAAAEHRAGIHIRGTTVLQQPQSRESTHQTTTKALNLCAFFHTAVFKVRVVHANVFAWKSFEHRFLWLCLYTRLRNLQGDSLVKCLLFSPRRITYPEDVH